MEEKNIKSAPETNEEIDPGFTSSYTKGQRIAAWVGIGVLVAMYITNIVFALTDNENTRTLTMCSIVCTILIPIILFFFIKMLNKKNPDISIRILFVKLQYCLFT